MAPAHYETLVVKEYLVLVQQHFRKVEEFWNKFLKVENVEHAVMMLRKPAKVLNLRVIAIKIVQQLRSFILGK